MGRLTNEKGSAQKSIAVTPKINHITSLLSHWCFLRHGRNSVGVRAGFVRKDRGTEEPGGRRGAGGERRGRGGDTPAEAALKWCGEPRRGAEQPWPAARPPAPFSGLRAGKALPRGAEPSPLGPPAPPAQIWALVRVARCLELAWVVTSSPSSPESPGKAWSPGSFAWSADIQFRIKSIGAGLAFYSGL